MKQRVIANPYLPMGTYIPDGEPHVFGNRVYIYGSHDAEGGQSFCMLPYECWSAPVNDLTDWRCEGTIYEASQDKDYSEKQKYMYAPDCVKGADGRYYLYYAMSGDGCFTGPIHVAVCDTPAGKFEYYGAVQTADGEVLDRYITFDPAVFADTDGKYFLYYGWSLEHAGATGPVSQEQLLGAETMLFGKSAEHIMSHENPYMGANVVELEPDMLTVKGSIKRVIPGQFESYGTEFEGHAFFEASSMRKIGNKYYFIYSSQWQHELCYAVSDYPDKEFHYGGVIISNGDIGFGGRAPEDRIYVTGNNHGCLEQINGKWYVFYHRQTHKTTYSRQGCAEPVEILADGSIPQVQITSCGLNGVALPADRSYSAAICCELTNGHMPHQGTEAITESMPHIANDKEDRFISEISDGTRIGYRYFAFDGAAKVTLSIRGEATGCFDILVDQKSQASIQVLNHTKDAEWIEYSVELGNVTGDHELTFVYRGDGQLQMKEISFE
ncbi:MAG: family 43 glycosylhydrolase [Eubacteriales bacterium]|nr:family 43 glycosylhydrolase [Eubacteriales bacterium]